MFSDKMIFYNLIESWMFKHDIDLENENNIKLIKAFKNIDRKDFVREDLKDIAYINNALPTYEGQTISQPEIVFDMTYYLELTGKEKVLEIGTGVGYQTAILAYLSKEVYTIERFKNLSDIAKANITKYNFKNIKFFTGDGSKGLEDFAPFDRIIVTAAAPRIPESLKNQLVEGGIMIIPVADTFYNQMLVKYVKGKGVQSLFPCVFVKLIGEEGYRE